MFSYVIILRLNRDIKISLFSQPYYIFQVAQYEQLYCAVADVTTCSSDKLTTPFRMFLQYRYPAQGHQCVSKSLHMDIVITKEHRIFLEDVKRSCLENITVLYIIMNI